MSANQLLMLHSIQKLTNLKKIPNHDKTITTQEFNKLSADNFAAILKEVKKTHFDGTLINVNKKLLQIKRYIEVEKIHND